MDGMLKRKRSDSELSISSSTTLPSPPHPTIVDFSATATQTAQNSSVVPAMFRLHPLPLHLPSRTLKRFRNSRPSDAEVHEHTLKLLYAAQKSAHRRALQPPEELPQRTGEAASLLQTYTNLQNERHNIPSGLSADQPSLFRFWDIPRPAHGQLQPDAISHADCVSVETVDVGIERSNEEDADMCMEDSHNNKYLGF